jgi:hypothetical protein
MRGSAPYSLDFIATARQRDSSRVAAAGRASVGPSKARRNAEIWRVSATCLPGRAIPIAAVEDATLMNPGVVLCHTAMSPSAEVSTALRRVKASRSTAIPSLGSPTRWSRR